MDLKRGVVREAGDTFIVSRARYEEIVGRHPGLVEPVAQPSARKEVADGDK